MRRVLAPERMVPARRGPAPTFSVLIATYDAADVVGEAIESALRQTAPPLEIIISDDGSTDDIEAALRAYGDCLVVLRAPHRGVAAAKNAGVRAARGDFVAILDADDVYLPERLEALRDLAVDRPDLDILTTDAFLEADGRPLRRYYEGPIRFAVAEQRTAILAGNFILGLAAVRRDRLLAVGGFDERLTSAVDWDCWIRLILSGSYAGLVAEPLARYRLRPTGLSSKRERRLAGRIAALEKALTHADLSSVEREAASTALGFARRELLLETARAALLAGSPPDARRSLRAIAADGGFPRAVRVRAAAAALAPRLASRHARRMERRTWVTAGGIRVRR